MNYVISDFKNLVGAWFNEFLPVRFPDKFKSVDQVGILYLDSTSLDCGLKDSVRFLLDKGMDISRKHGAKCIVVREPKPVNNIALHPFLSHLESCPFVADATRTKLLHLSNRRYVPSSELVCFSNLKHLDELLDGIWRVLEKLNLNSGEGCSFYSSSSFDLDSVVDLAKEIIPRKSLLPIVQDEHAVQPCVKVVSTNDMMMDISLKLMVDGTHSPSSDMKRFMEKCKDDVRGDLEQLL